MKRNLKILLCTSIVPFLINFIVLPFLPHHIPVHYDILGKVDRMGSRFEILIFPILICIMTLFWILTINNYKKSSENISTISQLVIGINVIYNMMNLYYLFMAMDVFTAKFLNIFSGISSASILIISGMATKSAKRSSLFGIRTKWTLLDDYCWTKTNRLGGNLLIIAGIFIALFFLISSLNKILIIIIVLALVVFVSIIYSYCIYKTRRASDRYYIKDNK